MRQTIKTQRNAGCEPIAAQAVDNAGFAGAAPGAGYLT